MIKDLLLVVDIGSGDSAIVDGALRLAEHHRAHLAIAIVSAIPLPDYTVTMYPPFISLDEYREKTAVKERMLLERASHFGVEPEIRVLSDAVHILLDKAPAQTRYADLVIFGPAETWEDQWLRRRVLENVLLGSGRPVLLLPIDGAIPSFERAMIGWNAGPEATRAIQAILPHLKKQAEITIAIVNPHVTYNHHGSDPGADIARHLARHDLRVEVTSITAPDSGEAEALRTLATSRDADLLVMGAFARSRLRELVLGGVTEEMIVGSSVPTFLMH